MARTKQTKKNTKTNAPKRSRSAAAIDDFAAEDHPVLGGEQSILPGTESPENKEIEKTATDLDKAKRNYAAWGRTAGVLNERLVGLMHAEGTEHYWRNGVEVNIKASDPKEKAEVTIERG